MAQALDLKRKVELLVAGTMADKRKLYTAPLGNGT